MIKPAGLSRLLLRAVPQLAADATKLQLFVDKGRIAARKGKTIGYEEHYTLAIVVQEFVGDVDQLFVPIMAWVAEQQPDLLDKGEPFTFATEILDGDKADIQIDLQLSELVRVEEQPDGTWATARVDQRAIGADEFPGVCGATLWTLIANGELVAQSSDPRAAAA